MDLPLLTQFIDGVKNYLFGLGFTVFVIGVIVGGLLRATAFGSERRIAVSNIAISCAVVGFIVILLASPLGNALQAAFPQP
jgi:uncharacterized membrane protein